jgi:hypothetical protein
MCRPLTLRKKIKADRSFMDSNLLDYQQIQPVKESKNAVKAKGVTVKSHHSLRKGCK